MKKWDIPLIVAVALLSLLPLLLLSPKGETVVTVTQHGEVLYEGALDTDALIVTPDGNNTIEIQNGQAHMQAAHCPDGLCLHGTASPLRPIACLPNGVLVTVSEREEAFDAITY